jgi:RNA polymerase sigma-70 factor (ECF subfamily)
MSCPEMPEFTVLLAQFRGGNKEAGDLMVSVVYQELRRLAQYYMGRERRDHTLQATALVHEAYIRLFGGEGCHWRDRHHFFAVAAAQMRRLLVDRARANKAGKRDGGLIQVPLEEVTGRTVNQDEDLMALDEALGRLKAVSPRASRMVELRFFGGLTEAEVAELLGISTATLRRDWDFAKAWLYRQIGHGSVDTSQRREKRLVGSSSLRAKH